LIRLRGRIAAAGDGAAERGHYQPWAGETSDAAGPAPGQPAQTAWPRGPGYRPFVDWERGSLARNEKRYDEAAALLTRALAAGEDYQFYNDRGDT